MTTIGSSIVRNLIFPLWVRRDHPQYPGYIREFNQSQFFDSDQLRELQTNRLRKLLKHAYDNCAFYHRRMDEAGFLPGDFKTLDQVRSLPVLTKREIQNFGNDMMARNIPENERVRNQTGGSTGSPLQFYVDKARFASRLASTVRHNHWAGMDPGDWCGELWGARLDQLPQESFWDRCRNTLLYRMVPMNTSSIRPEDWDPFISGLRKRRVRFLVTYTQSAALFARYLREKGIDDIRFQSIITTAEILLPGQRKFLEDTFRARVFNRYGCREVSVMASECDQHTGMHVNGDALLVEILEDPAYPPPNGRILITDMLNYSMPLIRYEIGDVGRWAEAQKCPCGRGLPLLEDVQGRITDFLVLPNGNYISGPSLTLVVSDMPDVAQVQFVQRSPQQIVLRVVPGKGYGEGTRQELRRRISLYLRGDADLSLEEVPSIASEMSGKYRFVVNEMTSRPLEGMGVTGGQG